MGKYLSIAGARHLMNKIKENYVSSNAPINAAYATESGHADTANSANRANQAANDAAGNEIHSTYLTQNDAAEIYLKKGGNAVSSTNAKTAETCTGNAENATRLAAKCSINVEDATGLNSGTAVDFDGTEDVTIKLPATISATLNGNASTATRATSDSAGNVIANHYAPNNNPVFTGTPQAPTAADSADNNQIATTAFVQAVIKLLLAEGLATKQNLNAALTSISQLDTSADKLIYTTAKDVYATTILTEFMRTLLDDVDAKTARNTLDALGKSENAVSAAKLETPRSVQTNLESEEATKFDGTKNISTGISGILPIIHGGTGNSNGNSASATKLETARKISVSDGLNIGLPSNFDGSGDVTLNLPSTIKATLNGNADSATKATQDASGNVITSTYAPINNPTLTGTPKAPTAESITDDNQIATTKFVQTAIKNLIGTAPSTLDTLAELANAISQDKNFAVTITEKLATKQNLNDALTSISNLVTSADKLIYTNAPDSYVTTTLTEFARALLDDVDAKTARNTLDALGKSEQAISARTADSATKAEFSTRAERDSDGFVFAEKYMPKIESDFFVLHTENWIEDSDANFKFYYDFTVDNLTANDIVIVNLTPESHGLSVKCGLCPTCEITDGNLRIRSKEIPTFYILGEYHILKGASSNKVCTLGSVNTSTSQRVIIYKTPEQTGTLTFNKNVQVPTWDDYDPTKLLMTGEISGIDAKTYTVTFTPIGNCTWSDDTRTPRSQPWKIERAVTALPSQSETQVYNGSAQTPRLNDFRAEEITLSGDFENLVDAGIYTAYATPTSNYKFDDDSTDTKPFELIINKAAQIFTVDKPSLYLENILMSDTVIVNRLGDGVISVTSSDESVVTVSNVDSEVTVTAVATGNATVKIDVAESKNYTAATMFLPVETYVIKALEQCTPAEIVDALDSGKAQNAWDAGDITVPITLNGKIGDSTTLENVQLCAMLIGLNHNTEFESVGKFSAHFVLGVNTALTDENYGEASASGVKYFQHNTSVATNEGGWQESNLRSICDDIFNALPDEWKAVITPCTKYTDNVGGGSDDSGNVTDTVDKIFLLSEFEVFGKKSYANSAEQNFQAQYDYFKNGNSKIRYKDSTACHWWLRSPQASNNTSFARVNPSGTVGSFNARYSQGIVPAFMVTGW